MPRINVQGIGIRIGGASSVDEVLDAILGRGAGQEPVSARPPPARLSDAALQELLPSAASSEISGAARLALQVLWESAADADLLDRFSGSSADEETVLPALYPVGGDPTVWEALAGSLGLDLQEPSEDFLTAAARACADLHAGPRRVAFVAAADGEAGAVAVGLVEGGQQATAYSYAAVEGAAAGAGLGAPALLRAACSQCSFPSSKVARVEVTALPREQRAGLAAFDGRPAGSGPALVDIDRKAGLPTGGPLGGAAAFLHALERCRGSSLDSPVAAAARRGRPAPLRRGAGGAALRGAHDARGLAAAMAARRSGLPRRAAVVFRTAAEAAAALAALRAGRPHAALVRGAGPVAPSAAPRGAVFVFSGLGPQWAGMALALSAEPEAHAALRDCNVAYERVAGGPLLPRWRGLSSDEMEHRVEIGFPAVFVLQVMLARQLAAWGVKPTAVLGHSAGEIAAAYVSGRLGDLRTAMAVAHHVGRALQAASGTGRLLAVSLSAADFAAKYGDAFDEQFEVAAENAPGNCTLAGTAFALEEMQRKLQADGVSARLLRGSIAFHSSALDPILQSLEASLDEVFAAAAERAEEEGKPWPPEPTCPFYAGCLGAASCEEGECLTADFWVRSVRDQVRFGEAVASCFYATEPRPCFVELSPHPVLVNYVAASVPGALALHTLHRGEPDERASLLRAAAGLYVAGAAPGLCWPLLAGAAPPAAAAAAARLPGPREWWGAEGDAPDDAADEAPLPERLRAFTAAVPIVFRERSNAARAQLLGVGPEELDPTRPLREYGIESISAVQLKFWIDENVRPDIISQVELVEGPSLAAIEARFEALEAAPAPADPFAAAAARAGPGSVGEREGQREASPQEEGMYMVQLSSPDSAGPNVCWAVLFEGDRPAPGDVLKALLHVVNDDPIFRTRYTVGAEGIVAVVDPPLRAASALPVEAARADSRAAAVARFEAVAGRPFSLESEPPLRGLVCDVPGGRLVGLSIHHIAIDGFGLSILSRRFGDALRSVLAGRPPAPAVRATYGDFARAQLAREEEVEAAVAALTRNLTNDLEPLDFPVDVPAAHAKAAGGPSGQAAGHIQFSLPADLVKGLEAESRRSATRTKFSLLLAAFAALLRRYTGREDLLIGCPFANRSSAWSCDVVGLCINTLLLRVGVPSDCSFAALCDRTAEAARSALANQAAPLQRVARHLRAIGVDSAVTGEVLFALQNLPARDVSAGEGLAGRWTPAYAPHSSFPLALEVFEEDGGMRVHIMFWRARYTERLMRQFGEHFVAVVRAGLAQPDSPAGSLPIMAPAELRLVTSDFADGSVRDGPLQQKPACIHAAFERQARQRPEAVALAFNAREVTYGELDAWAEAIAARLAAAGARRGGTVALLLSRTPEMVASLLAVLKTGAAYVPIDPSVPAERARSILEDAEPKVLITNLPDVTAIAGGLPIHVERVSGEALAAPAAPAQREAPTPDDVCYIIFTSGTTGKPKGVEIRHSSVTALMEAMGLKFGTEAEGATTLHHTYQFDASVWEIWVALAFGRTLVIVPEIVAMSPHDYVDLIAARGVTHILATPSFFSVMLESGWAEQRAKMKIRHVTVGGEAVPFELARRWRALAPAGATLWNVYGPTEITVVCTAGPLDERCLEAGRVTIGRPFRGWSCFVVDKQDQPVPVGVWGELLVGGAGVARGYVRRPDLTASKFVPCPVQWTGPGDGPVYRTGDLVRWTAEGEIEFRGRIDLQVKIRGYRVEPGEAAAALLKHASVQDAYVIPYKPAGPDELALAAYVVLRTFPCETEKNSIRAHARASLPSYMVPSAFVYLDELPMTTNGKVNAKALPPPDQAQPQADPHLPPTCSTRRSSNSSSSGATPRRSSVLAGAGQPNRRGSALGSRKASVMGGGRRPSVLPASLRRVHDHSPSPKPRPLLKQALSNASNISNASTGVLSPAASVGIRSAPSQSGADSAVELASPSGEGPPSPVATGPPRATLFERAPTVSVSAPSVLRTTLKAVALFKGLGNSNKATSPGGNFLQGSASMRLDRALSARSNSIAGHGRAGSISGSGSRPGVHFAVPEGEEAADREAQASHAPRSPLEPAASIRSATASNLEIIVAEAMSEALSGHVDIGRHDSFFDMGGHSLAATKCVARLRARFEVDVRVPAIFEHPTPAGLAAHVSALLAAKFGGGGGAGGGAGAQEAKLPTIASLPAGPDGERQAPASEGQQQLWFLAQLQPGSDEYNVPLPLLVAGPLDVGLLALAVGQLVARHEALRTTLAMDGDRLVQVAAPAAAAAERAAGEALRVREVAQASMDDEIRAAGARPFDLQAGPLFGCTVLRVSDTYYDEACHVVILAAHHAVIDGASLASLLQELAALYGGYARLAREKGAPPAVREVCGGSSPAPAPAILGAALGWARDIAAGILAPVAVQYAEYALWQAACLQGAYLESGLAFWKKTLAGVPAIELPYDFVRPAGAPKVAGTARFSVPGEVMALVDRFSHSANCSHYMVFLAAFAHVLQRLAGADDFAIGTPVAARPLPELETTVGYLVNTVAIRSKFERSATFAAAAKAVREAALGAFAHDYVPFSRVVSAVQANRDAGRNPIYQVMFAVESWTELAVGDGDGVLLDEERETTAEVLSYDFATPKFDLSLTVADAVGVADDPRAAACNLEYRADLFSAATAQRIAEHFVALLSAALKAPDAPLSRHAILSAAEHRLVTSDFADGSVRDGALEGAPSCIHTAFERQARQRPKALALVHGPREVTYGELDAWAEAIAARLTAAGARRESRVALIMDKAPEAIAAMLGTLKAGAAYVPIDPATPIDRMLYIFEDSGARWLLSHSSGDLPTRVHKPASDAGVEVILADAIPPGLQRRRRPVPVEPSNLAYCIYTSGTTGRPKGVAVEHEGVVRQVEAVAGRHLAVGPADAWAQFFSISFDGSVEEIYGALLRGSPLVLVPKARAPPPPPSPPPSPLTSNPSPIQSVGLSPGQLLELVAARRIAVLDIPTAFLDVLSGELQAMSEGSVAALRLRHVIVGGDRLLSRQVLAFAAACRGRVKLWNTYGPTEATVDCTIRLVDAEQEAASEAQGRCTIGRPFAGRRLFVVDKGLAPVPPGVWGELLIGGDGVARGYLNRPELTEEKFCWVDVAGRPERVYRSGDVVRWLPDGTLEFRGRADTQVKIRGFRVEPGEVAAVLQTHAAVRAAVVVPAADASGIVSGLNAYVVLDDAARGQPEAALEAELEGHARRTLPPYMMPASYTFLEAFPTTIVGKIDTRALPPPRPRAGAAGAEEAEGDSDAGGAGEAMTAVEEAMAAIWREILGVKNIRLDSDFFLLGGTSIAAARCVSRANRGGLPIGIVDVFEAPTLRGLAARAASSASGRAGPSAAVTGQTLLEDAKASAAPLLFLLFLMSRPLIPPAPQEAARQVEVPEAARGALPPGPLRPLPRPGARLSVLVTGASGFLGAFVLQVNHVKSYASLKRSNVAGAVEVARFAAAAAAARGAPVPLHFVSTISVYGLTLPRGVSLASEAAPLDEYADQAAAANNGYLSSKFVAEQAMHELAARGLPVCVWRPGLVCGSLSGGPTAWNALDTTSRVIKGSVQCGVYPEEGEGESGTPQPSPADFCGRAIAFASLERPARCAGATHNLVSWRPEAAVRTGPIYAELRARGYKLEPVSPDHFYTAVLDQIENEEEGTGGKDNALYPLISSLRNIYRLTSAGSLTASRDAPAASDGIVYGTAALQGALEGSGVDVPPYGGAAACAAVDYFVASAFVPPPAL
eukprot:tig00020892_g14924.t1